MYNNRDEIYSIAREKGSNMELAKVNLTVLTARVNRVLGTSHDEPYMSKVRAGNAGSAALQKVTRDEIAKMLQEAAEAAKAGT
jgi:hypothetical protein